MTRSFLKRDEERSIIRTASFFRNISFYLAEGVSVDFESRVWQRRSIDHGMGGSDSIPPTDADEACGSVSNRSLSQYK